MHLKIFISLRILDILNLIIEKSEQNIIKWRISMIVEED